MKKLTKSLALLTLGAVASFSAIAQSQVNEERAKGEKAELLRGEKLGRLSWALGGYLEILHDVIDKKDVTVKKDVNLVPSDKLADFNYTTNDNRTISGDDYFFWGLDYMNDETNTHAMTNIYFYGDGALEVEFNVMKKSGAWSMRAYADTYLDKGLGNLHDKEGEQYFKLAHASGAYFQLGTDDWYDIDQSVIGFERADDRLFSNSALGGGSGLGGVVLGYEMADLGLNVGVLYSNYTLDGTKTDNDWGKVDLALTDDDDDIAAILNLDTYTYTDDGTITVDLQRDNSVIGLLADYNKNNAYIRFRFLAFKEEVNKDSAEYKEEVSKVNKDLTKGSIYRNDLFLSASYKVDMNESMYVTPVLNYTNNTGDFKPLVTSVDKDKKATLNAQNLMFGIKLGIGEGRFGLSYSGNAQELEVTGANIPAGHELYDTGKNKQKLEGNLFEFGYERDFFDADATLSISYSSYQYNKTIKNSTGAKTFDEDGTENILRLATWYNF